MLKRLSIRPALSLFDSNFKPGSVPVELIYACRAFLEKNVISGTRMFPVSSETLTEGY